MNRYPDWLEQARRNLEHAEGSITLGHFAWACFAAQQAAEAAAKALHLRFGQFARGHAVTDLLAELPDRIRPEAAMLDSARVLDKYYIPTRYPDAHPAGSADRNYTRGEAEEAVSLAREIVNYGERKSLEAR